MDQDIKQNQGGVGAPPSGEVGIRTMGSDTGSIQRGDSSPMPESVLPPQNEKEAYFKPETQVGETNLTDSRSPSGSENHIEKGGKKWVFWMVFGLVIIGVGLLGYFIVGPLLFPQSEVVESPVPTPTESAMVHRTYFI